MTENILFDLTPLGVALGWALVHSTWQILIVAGLLVQVLRFVPRMKASLRYVVLFSGLGLITCWSFRTFLVAWQTENQLQGAVAEELAVTGPTHGLASEVGGLQEVSVSWAERLHQNVDFLLPFLTIGWFIGISLVTLSAFLGWRHLRYLRRTNTSPLPREWSVRLKRLSRQMRVGRKVEVLVSGLVQGPVTFSVVRPVILLPCTLFSGLAPVQIEALLLHELAHIRRFDYLFNILQTVVEVVFFYHPAIWWIAGQLREERENCCDDLVLAVQKDPFTYAEALTQIQLNHFSMKKRLAMYANGKNGSLSRRVKRLFGHYENQSSVHNSVALVLFLLVGGLWGHSFSFAASEGTEAEKMVTTASVLPLDTLPLLVVDGNVKGNFQPGVLTMSPDDIERVNVLKGEHAIAIYGSAAQYGAVEVITKEGADEEVPGTGEKEVVRLELVTDDGPVIVTDTLEFSGTPEEQKIGKHKPLGNSGPDASEDPDDKVSPLLESHRVLGRRPQVDTVDKAESKIIIRGGGRTDPMYVVDGEVLTGGIGKINPEQIERIEVYKDSAAIAAYGSGAKNGVVEIWLKKSAEEKSEKVRKKSREKMREKRREVNAIKGEVLGRNGIPLIGASIIISGTHEGTITDLDGKFVLEAQEGDVLAVSYIGFQTRMVTVGKDDLSRIQLLEGVALEEVEVVAPRSQPTPDLDPQFKVFPNPARSRIQLEFLLSDKSDVGLRAYTADGKLIETIFQGELEAGRQQMIWRTPQNQEKGLYLIRLEIGDSNMVYSRQVIIE